MGSINLTFHPLFFLFGIYQALTGKIFIFIICTISALLHEIGHSVGAGKLGYKLNQIVLMPFGAVVKGNIDGLNLKDEIRIALAGPLINLYIGLFLVALWWIFPETYAFTDVVAETNFSLALVNFLPIYPLDGGRIVYAIIALKSSKEKANKVCAFLGLGLSLVLLGLFIFSIFHECNLSLLFFSAFTLFGTFSKSKVNHYVSIYSSVSTEKLKHGMPIKRQAIDKSATIKRLIAVMDSQSINEIVVFEKLRPVKTLSQQELEKLISSASIYDKISDYI